MCVLAPSCSLDNGESGLCISEKECPASDSESVCGFIGQSTAVCCPKGKIQTSGSLTRKQRSPVSPRRKQIRQGKYCKSRKWKKIIGRKHNE